MLKSNRLEADMSRVLPAFPKKSRLSGFWISLLSPCPDEPLIDLTAITNLRITILSIAVKITSCSRLSTVQTALLGTFLILSSTLFCLNWFWHALPKNLSKSLCWPLVCCSKVSFNIALTVVPLPVMKSFIVSFNWLSCLFCWFFFLLAETLFPNGSIKTK